MKSRARPSQRLEARINPTEKSLLERAAHLEGRTITDFVVSRAVEDAKRIIQEHDSMVLTERNQRAFVDALLTPPTPAPALKAAFKSYAKRFGR